MADFFLKLSLSVNSEQGDYVLDYNGPGKFKKDCVFYENAQFLVLIDGVILNKCQIIKDYGFKDWTEGIINLYNQHGEVFFELLKGSYYGIVFDKKMNKWIFFTDHIGTKPIYYHNSTNHIYFSNNYKGLVNQLRSDSVNISLDINSAYLLLTYGFVFEEKTISNEIKRLLIGSFGKIQKSIFTEHAFYKILNEPKEISENEAIEGIDERFRNAIQLAFEKDKEYGFKHLVSLSGGLDSRMTSWVAHEMGYTDQLNITFSQSNYLDESIPKQIAADLKHEWLFKALDNGLFLFDIDEITKISGGNVLYYGLAHNQSLFKLMNFEKFGILHTGQLGDVSLSSFYTSLKGDKKIIVGDGAYSTSLIDRINNIKFRNDYPNQEIFKIIIRGLYGANQGLKPIQNYTETYSPFYDIDLLKYSFSIPLNIRYNHALYKKWILKKYQGASRYKWESTNSKITAKVLKYKGKELPIKSIPSKVLQKVGLIKPDYETNFHMNPISYWYNTNAGLKKFQDNYFEENIEKLSESLNLKKDCINLYRNGSGVEKNQVLSLIAAVRIIILNE